MKLDILNISKSYGKNKALTDFTATLEPGIYALLGPNGSGKSTLMNIITDNLKADSGTIMYSDEGKEPENVLDMDVRFREKLGFMPQYPGMYSGFSIEEFLWYMASLKNVGSHLSGKDRKLFTAERINEILTAVELDDVAGRKIGALSGGMKQRLALAQAVLGDPSILILDEPTAGLDPKQRIAIRNYISKIAFNKIVIIATHVVSDVEYTAKDIIILKKGVIVDYAPPAQLTEKIYGKVWNVYTDKESADDYQNRFRVTNISREDERVVLRIISESKPDENAVAAQPSLEDYYLYVFGDEAASGNQ